MGCLFLLQEPITLHAMSSGTSTFVLDNALSCIGERIAFILIQPADNDKNYITSLHNEVIGISPL